MNKFSLILICFIQVVNFTNGQNLNVLLTKADSLSNEQDFINANSIYRKTFIQLEEKGDWRRLIETSIKLVNNYYEKKEIDSALIILNERIPFSEKYLGIRDSLTATLYHKKGIGLTLGKAFFPAINFYKKAFQIREMLFKDLHPDMILSLNNIAMCFEELGKIDSAEYYLDKSLALQPNPPFNSISTTYMILGRVSEVKGDFKKAENFYLANLNISRLIQKSHWEIATEFLDLSYFYYSINNYHKTISFANNGIELYLGIEDKIKEDYEGIANSYHNIGIAQRKLRNYDLAVMALEKALKWSELAGINEIIAHTYSSLGITYREKRDFKKGIFFLEKALKIYEEVSYKQGLTEYYNNLGDIYFDQKEFATALELYHQSLPNFSHIFKGLKPYETLNFNNSIIDDKGTLLVILASKAKTFKALYNQNHQEKDLKAAHETYQLLDELIDDVRLSYLEDASKSYLVKQAKPIYEKAIGLCLQYHQYSQDEKYLAEAFKYAEKSKAIILLEQIKESRANIAASIPDSVRQKERQLKKEIGQIEKQLALQGEEITADSLGKSLREQLIRVKNEYEDLVEMLEKANADYHQLKYDLQTVDIPTIQQAILKEGQQLVEYFVGEDSMYLFSIGKDKFEVIPKPLDFDLKAWTDSLRQGIYYCRINNTTTKETCDTLDRQYEAYALKLYQKLIAPLNLPLETEEIIFIPDGVLGYIPFDALLTKAIPDNQQRQFQNYPYLGLDKVVSYAFSATFLKELQQTISTIDNHKLLAFAPSFKVGVKEEDTFKVSPSMEVEDPIWALRSSLSPLLFNEREVEQVGANFGGKTYVNQQANKLSFIQEAPNYRYLHIASHGKMNDADADLSYIAFTQDGDSTNQEELLYLRELYDLDIPADMVVLSACETGIGELQNGEGIISLARGFSYAGAKSIITSLWAVNDQKTTDLMVDFYQNLKEGQTKNHALATAKRDYISDNSATFSHPFYWAGFIPIGNMERVEAANDWTWLPYALGGVSLLTGFFFWQSKRTKRKVSPIAA